MQPIGTFEHRMTVNYMPIIFSADYQSIYTAKKIQNTKLVIV